MHKKLLILLAGTLLAGCATTKGYRQMLDTWIGADEKTLLESNWGIPDKTFELGDGEVVYCYKNHRIESTPSEVYTNRWGETTVLSGSIYELNCQTCFYIDQDYVIYHYTFKGNNCLAHEKH